MVLSSEIVETRTSSIFLREENFIEMRMKKDIEIGVEDVKEQLETLKQLNKNQPFLLIVFPAVGNQITKEAREYKGIQNKDKGVIAQAIVTNNLAHRLMSRVFTKINRPPQPIKLFKNEKDAVKWLKSFI